jgi:hypothetical protein
MWISGRKLGRGMALVLAAGLGVFQRTAPAAHAQAAVPVARTCTPAEKKAALVHWHNAKALETRRPEDSLHELQAAYRICPDRELLFLIGAQNARLEHHVEAIETLEKYLNEGGDRISPERRTEVQEYITREMAFIAILDVRTTPPGVSVRLDGSPVGETPLPRPLRVAQGFHRLVLSREGYVTVERDKQAERGKQYDITVDLTPAPPPAATIPSPTAAVATIPEARRAPDLHTRSVESEPVQTGLPSARDGRRLVSALVAGAGVAAGAVGGLLAWKFTVDGNAAVAEYERNPQRREALLSEYNRAATRSRNSWIAAGVGIAAAAVAGGFYFFAVPAASPHSAALSVQGRF